MSLLKLLPVRQYLDGFKRYYQRELGRSKRSRLVFDLHLLTMLKPPEKIINSGIFRIWENFC